MRETYTLDEIKEKLEHEKYLRKENQELYEELQVLRKCSDGTNDLANEYKKRIDKVIEYIDNLIDLRDTSEFYEKSNKEFILGIIVDILKGVYK